MILVRGKHIFGQSIAVRKERTRGKVFVLNVLYERFLVFKRLVPFIIDVWLALINYDQPMKTHQTGKRVFIAFHNPAKSSKNKLMSTKNELMMGYKMPCRILFPFSFSGHKIKQAWNKKFGIFCTQFQKKGSDKAWRKVSRTVKILSQLLLSHPLRFIF